MNRFAQLLAQARAIWASLGTGPRVTLLAFAGGMAVLLAGLAFWSAQTDYVLLYGGLAPEDAATISTRLSDDKIPFRYEASRGAILVPASRADAARLDLATAGLPKNATDGFEVFDKMMFGTTDFAQRINFQRALQTTLAHNIQALEGVDSAHVTLSLPEDEVFTRERREAKASVVVRMRGGHTLGGDQVNSIRHMVASSVPKLDARNVTVVDSAGRMLSRPQEADDATALSEDQLAMQQRVETRLADKVQSLLDQVLGPGQAAVRVTAQLNFERVERSSQKMDPDSGVLLEEASRNEDVSGRGNEPGGVPGVASNSASGAAPGAINNAVGSSRKQKIVTNRYHYDTITEKVVPEIGAIKRLSVAVLVAAKAPGAVPNGAAANTKAASTARTPQELSALTEIVRSAVGYAPERKDVIKVEEVPFSETAPLAAPLAAPAPSPWLEFLQRHFSDALAFLGILALAAVLWRLFAALAAPAPMPAPVVEATASQSVSLPAERSSVLVQNELKELVTQNNTQAVNIIRSMLK